MTKMSIKRQLVMKISNSNYSKFCVNCGAKLTPGNKFCPDCGHQIISDPPEESLEEKYAISREKFINQPQVKLTKMLKDKRNLYTFTLTLLSLLFIIIGIYPIVLEFYNRFVSNFQFNYNTFTSLFGLIMVNFLFIIISLIQGAIIYLVITSIKNKGEKVSIFNAGIKKGIKMLSGINYVFIIIAVMTSPVFSYAPINGAILFISPLLNIAAALIIQEYNQSDMQKSQN